jgi:molybdate transport system substrate-binding protein
MAISSATRCFAAVALVLVLGRAASGEVLVSAAASLTEVLRDESAAWARRGGEPVAFNFGASSLLARQIAEGAPADLFFSADEAKMDDLERRGLVAAGTRKTLLSNTLVIVVSQGTPAAISGPKDLAGPAVRTLVLGETRTVPAGIYAREYLEKQKLWDAVASKVVPSENVRAALAAVESGNADAAIVYRSDALISKNVRVAFEVPAGSGPKISYPAAALTGAKNPSGARRFLEFLSSAEGLEIFRRSGFRTP